MKNFRVYYYIYLAQYAIVYFVYTFVAWRIDNPIQWILDIPTYDGNTRMAILLMALMLACANSFIAKVIIKSKTKE